MKFRVLLFFWGLLISCGAQTLSNGDFDDLDGLGVGCDPLNNAFTLFPPVVPQGWIYQDHPLDTYGSATPDWIMTNWAPPSPISLNSSPAGGNAINLISVNNFVGSLDTVESFATIMTGLTPGEEYELSFYFAPLNGVNSNDDDYTNGIIEIGDFYGDGSVMTFDTGDILHSFSPTWMAFDFTFTATATSHFLTVHSGFSSFNGARRYSAWDGFRFTVVPEPTSLFLTLGSFGFLVLWKRVREN